MVKLILSRGELISERAGEADRIGFVPTMGNLHQGHISLLEEALKEFKTVYFSIFVNPKQFGPTEDFGKYPRTLETDLELIAATVEKFPNSQIKVFSPKDPKEVFPEDGGTSFKVLGLSTVLEGKIRPGHFEGVATVVYQLFDMVRPSKAYFGLKDYQQYLVIRQMVKDLGISVNIQGMPIIREPEGLALSSRNQYLTQDQKKSSLVLYKTLNEVKSIIGDKKENIKKAQLFIDNQLQDKNWNYLELRDAESLSPDLSGAKAITILAVYQLGGTRLLDNMQVKFTVPEVS